MNETVVREAERGARTVAPRRNTYGLWALGFIALGALLLGHNLGLLPPGILAQATAYWPVLVIALGLWVALGGRPWVQLPPAPFALPREAYPSAALVVTTRWADVQVGAFVGMSQLAVGQFVDPSGPRVSVEEGRVRVDLHHRAAAPFAGGDWSAALAKGLPWSLDLRSDFGHLRLNLRDLTVTALALRSVMGNVDLTVPATGQGVIDLSLGLGDLVVRVPEGMAVRVRLQAGSLSNIRLQDTRLIRAAPNEWVTPNFSASPHRSTLTIALGTGDLSLE